MRNNYKAELYYGWCSSHDTYDVYHAFELTDPKEQKDSSEIGDRLAELLDTTRDDDDFDFRSMLVSLPDSVIQRIQDDAVAAETERYQTLLLAARLMHEWLFLHCADEEEVYAECGLTAEMNALLGYGGKVVVELTAEGSQVDNG